jgi:hypothetical protein
MFCGVYICVGKFKMSKNLFLPGWNNFVDHKLVKHIINHLESDDSVVLKDFNFLEYTKGITFENEQCENGMYIFRFSDGKYYVGKASSCTLLERISKHIDGRRWGGFNAVLKELGYNNKSLDYHIENQLAFLNAKVVLLPISWDSLSQSKVDPKIEKPLHKLESDLIFLFKKRFSENQIINKTNPKKLSGMFEFE